MSATSQLFEDEGGFFTDWSVAGDVRDPYPEFVEKRKHSPVERLPNLYGGADSFQVYRHPDVQRVLLDNETFSSSVLGELMGVIMGQKLILSMDEPEHRRHRALVSTAFRNKTLAKWEETLVQSVVDELIDRFADRGHADLVREFTFLFPVQVIARILGLPPTDHFQFQKWSLAIIGAGANFDRGLLASEQLKAYLSGILDERRAHPEDDLISDLVRADLDGEHLDDEEIFSFLRLLLPAGAETTYRSSGNLFFGLLSNPDQLDAVRRDRALVPQAIEEALRWEPPLLITGRVATREVTLSGQTIPAGAPVTPVMGSANRDESVFPDPDTFNIFRDPKPHISFGYGPHMCLGMHLARMETRVALNRLLDRLPNLRLDPAGDDPHIHGAIFRSPTTLPVLFG
jgi:cytochrome P450